MWESRAFLYIRMGQPVHAGLRQADSGWLLSGGLPPRSAQAKPIAELFGDADVIGIDY